MTLVGRGVFEYQGLEGVCCIYEFLVFGDPRWDAPASTLHYLARGGSSFAQGEDEVDVSLGGPLMGPFGVRIQSFFSFNERRTFTN